MSTSKKNKAIVFNPVGTDIITKTRIKQFWSENGTTNAQKLTDGAQKIIYEAWEAGTAEEMIRLAKQALTLSPFCLDAYNILAEYDCDTHVKAITKYELSIYAGNILLKSELENDQGFFWGLLETRPYMRSMAGLAGEYKTIGETEKAIAICEKMLVLNPNDNQGIRYLLLPCLLESKNINTTKQLLKQYDELSAFWLYSHALLAYIMNDKKKALIAKQAIKINSFIPSLLKEYNDNIGLDAHLQPIESEYYSSGSTEEAEIYAKENFIAWFTNSGAIDWLVQVK